MDLISFRISQAHIVVCITSPFNARPARLSSRHSHRLGSGKTKYVTELSEEQEAEWQPKQTLVISSLPHQHAHEQGCQTGHAQHRERAAGQLHGRLVRTDIEGICFSRDQLTLHGGDVLWLDMRIQNGPSFMAQYVDK